MFTIEHSRLRKQSENFHHVLIDMNQLLHITLRRARSEEHALTLLIKELDKYMEIASPTKSIVLAFDGPPAAAKLATQRRRRLNTVVRAERKRLRLERLKQRGLVIVPPPRKKDRRKDKAAKEEETLKITPGTEFMEKAHESVLYWAWQRLDSPKSKISHCRIYICPSTVPGEGEVKLLDWLLQAGSDRRMTRIMRRGQVEKEYHGRIVKPGESVAILGGDSDLVLEGLVIPPAITHNVFVILPSTGKISHVVSLWETTLTLGKYLGEKFDTCDIMRVRTDLVLLLIMNGNDYLPKLRGSAGFNKLFHSYLTLLKNWIKEDNVHRPYLVDPETLEFNVPFSLSYFQQLASIAPKQLSQPLDVLSNQNSVTPLSQLYSMSDAGFLPNPIEFQRIPAPYGKLDRLRLTLGEDGKESKQLQFDLDYDAATAPTLKKLKQTLAHAALEEILGNDYMDLDECFADDNISDDEEDFDDSGNVSSVYPWEISLPALSSVDEYLRGLLWNLSTYQDGVCSDYGYNYGRRLSPTAEEIVAYFENALLMKNRVNTKTLQGEVFVEPLSSGLSCLAALPSQVDFLIPEPFRLLSADGSVEDIYAQCMDPMNNVFDMRLFRNLCTLAIQERGISIDPDHRKKQMGRKSNLRKIRLGDTFWTVIHRVKSPLKSPYEPPKPFSNRLSNLRFNPCIKVSHILATDKPRWLQFKEMQGKRKQKQTNDYISTYGIMRNLVGSEFGSDSNLEDVGYKMVYHTKNEVFQKKDTLFRLNRERDSSLRQNSSPNSVESVKLNSQIVQSSKLNVDGFNAIQCLQQLKDANLIEDIKWIFSTPFDTNHLSEQLGTYEEITLSISIAGKTPLMASKARNSQMESRKLVKHALASDVMGIIFQDCDIPWHDMSVKQKKEILLPGQKPVSQVDNINALQRLHQLRDAHIIDLSWEEIFAKGDSVETIRLKINTCSSNFCVTLEDTRDAFQDSKASLKHRLADGAMKKLLGAKRKNWKRLSLSELKDTIK